MDNSTAEATIQANLSNCTFSNNSASNEGGAIHTIVSASSAFEFIEEISPTIANSIFWGNTAPEGADIKQSIAGGEISHSILQANGLEDFTTYTDTLLRDPLFVNAANDSLQLGPGSPAFNTGSNTAAAGIATDLDGNPRIELGTVDIGAYEYKASCSDALRFFLPGKFINADDDVATNEDIEISSSILSNSDLSFTAGDGMTFLKEFEIETGSMMLVYPFNCGQ